ncbi:MAG TPA: hypothetical protein VNJ52_04345 [Patescibacteria group bacterium]|nr:hypothetical protein [Patescibacteria group bacterium]
MKEFLIAQARVVATIKTRTETIIPDAASPFLYLAFPWVMEPADAEQAKFLETRRGQFSTAGFEGDRVRTTLSDILAQDRQLRECCVGLGPLAHCLDVGFVSPAALLINDGAPQERLEELFQRFDATIYGEGRFKAISLCHVFNFHAEEPSLKFGDVRMERLGGPTISKILGETSAVSFFNPPGTGEFFIVSEQEGPCEEPVKWLFEKKTRPSFSSTRCNTSRME